MQRRPSSLPAKVALQNARAVISQFSQLIKDENHYVRSLGRAFNRAQEIRLRADYFYGDDPDAKDALEVRKSAIEFVAYCEILLQTN
jgi:hypothetical protein